MKIIEKLGLLTFDEMEYLFNLGAEKIFEQIAITKRLTIDQKEQYYNFSMVKQRTLTENWDNDRLIAEGVLSQEERDARIRANAFSPYNPNDYTYLMHRDLERLKEWVRIGRPEDFSILTLGDINTNWKDIYGPKERFTFVTDKNSPLSTFYPCKFGIGGVEFSSIVQAIQYSKADLMIDRESKFKILNAISAEEAFQLGQSVKFYNRRYFAMHMPNLMFLYTILKFRKNDFLKQALLETTGTTIVYNCSNEKCYGIGLNVGDKDAHDRSKWPGLNLGGEVLTMVRRYFLNEIDIKRFVPILPDYL